MPAEQQSGEESKGIALMKTRLSGFETEEGRLKGLSYQPRPNDVAITTTPKAGTTWLQQVGFWVVVAVSHGVSAFKLNFSLVFKPFVMKDMPPIAVCFQWR